MRDILERQNGMSAFGLASECSRARCGQHNVLDMELLKDLCHLSQNQ